MSVDRSFDTAGFRNYVSRVARDRGTLIVPGARADVPSVRSDDSAYLGLCARLADRLTAEFPQSPTSQGFFTLPGVPGNFLGLYTVAGYRMDPAGSPTREHAPTTRSTEFADKCHADILRHIARRAYRRWSPVTLRIASVSSSGLPHMTPDIARKRDHFSRFWTAAQDIKNCFEEDRLEDLYRRHDVVVAYQVGRRLQVDRVERDNQGRLIFKDRRVRDHNGKDVLASKEVTLHGHRRARMRTRLVYGMSGSVNYGLQAFFSGFRHHYMRDMAYAVHHTTPARMLEKIRPWPHVCSLDVRNFDQSMPSFLLHEAVDCMPISADMRDLMHRVLRAPTLVPNDYLGGRGCSFTADPLRSSSFDHDYGNPSGWAGNGDMNKVIGLFMMAVLEVMAGNLSPRCANNGDLDAWLDGRHGVCGILNMGDDNAALHANAHAHRHFLARVHANAHPYFELAEEPGFTFLGRTYAKSRGALFSLPNINSFVTKFLAPERGWDSPHRKNAGLGYFVRKYEYADHPSVLGVDRALQEEWRRVYGVTLDEQVGRHRYDPVATGRMNFAEILFADDPSVIHYRFDPSEVSPDLLDKYYLRIEPADVAATAAGHVNPEVIV